MLVKEKISKSNIKPQFKIDGEIHIDDMDEKFFETLRLLSPFGIGFPPPIFHIKGAHIKWSKISLEKIGKYINISIPKNSTYENISGSNLNIIGLMDDSEPLTIELKNIPSI